MLNALYDETNRMHPPTMLAGASHNRLPAELRHAIYHHELSLQYQPRYSTNSGDFSIMEALVRWHHPSLGQLQPDRFISIAEEHALICHLGLWVFEQSCKDMIYLRKQLGRQIRIAVNVSLLQCEDSLHALKIYKLCRKYRLELDDFEFELTESKNIKNRKKVLRFCETLIDLGAEISLDDFGTGNSPLNNLCDLPISCIKIDQCFTRKIGNGGRSEILINHLIKLAHEMGIKVVAEGIEQVSQLEQLIKMGCDQLQGFYMCKPLAAECITLDHINMYRMQQACPTS